MLDFCYFLCSTRPRVRCEPAICEKLRFLLRVPFLLSCLIFLFFLSFLFDCYFDFDFWASNCLFILSFSMDIMRSSRFLWRVVQRTACT